MKNLERAMKTEHKIYQLDLTYIKDDIARGQMLYQHLDEVLYELRNIIPFSSVQQFVLNTSNFLLNVHINRWLSAYFENVGFFMASPHTILSQVRSIAFPQGPMVFESNLFQHKIFIYPEFNDSNQTVSMRPELLFEIKLTL